MSHYPVSSLAEHRLCCWFFQSGTSSSSSVCTFYPCLHTASRDIDYLDDREHRLNDPVFHAILWACFRSPNFDEKFEAVVLNDTHRKFKTLLERCRRLEDKKHKIEEDESNLKKLMDRESISYFQYWNSFTREQLERFKHDPMF